MKTMKGPLVSLCLEPVKAQKGDALPANKRGFWATGDEGRAFLTSRGEA